jgi:hypothetical protein
MLILCVWLYNEWHFINSAAYTVLCDGTLVVVAYSLSLIDTAENYTDVKKIVKSQIMHIQLKI